MKRNSLKISKLDDMKYMTPILNKSNISKRNYDLFKDSNQYSSLQSIYRDTEKSFEDVRKKHGKKKEIIQNLADVSEDEELNFYGKMKTLHKYSNNIATINNHNELMKNKKRNSYLDVISHNIIENRQTLNNPQEFYTGFFTNIVQKRINKRKKSNKSKKDVNRILEVNKNKIRNNKYLFDNNDEEKTKNRRTIKRPSSTFCVTKQGSGLLTL